jgi:hypothetical protein
MSRVTRVYDRERAPRIDKPEIVQQRAAETGARRRWERIDWQKMEAQAAAGRIPEPPELSTTEPCRLRLLRDIHNIARQGDVVKLTEIRIGAYNSITKAISKYREICILALIAMQ